MNLNATLFAQMVVFLVLAWFTMKFVWPPLINALDERSKKIADGLAAAEKGKAELDAAHKRVDRNSRRPAMTASSASPTLKSVPRRSPRKSRPTPRLKPPASSPRRRRKQNSKS